MKLSAQNVVLIKLVRLIAMDLNEIMHSTNDSDVQEQLLNTLKRTVEYLKEHRP